MKGYMIFILLLILILNLVYGEKDSCKDDEIPCDDGECIARFFGKKGTWCDGYIDCRDESDEKNCISGYSCEDDEIPCDDGQCIARFFDDKGTWCDGYIDCLDESDEKNCISGSDNNCTDKHFECFDGRCIPLSLRCDRTRDCVDGSDEQECEATEQEKSTTSSPITQMYTSTLRSTTDYYQTKTQDESYSTHLSPFSSPPFYQNSNPDQNSHERGYDTISGRSFPNNRQPTISPYAPELTTQRWRYITAKRTQTGQDTSRSAYPQVPRYPPQDLGSSSPPLHNIRISNYAHFYFAKNYAVDTVYEYKINIRNARGWLLSQRDSFYGDTSKALIALSLISNSFQSDELLRKSLQTQLGVKLLRNDTGIENMSPTTLAMYINALLATCQDPRDFMALDLGEILYYRQYHLERDQTFVNPLIFLSLCLVDLPINVDYLQAFLLNAFPDKLSKDLHILATTAMACVAQQNPNDRAVKSKLDEAVRNLLKQMNADNGSFGDIYSTALAAQVLMSVNTPLRWDHWKTLDYLAQQQRADGSFGDLESTYHAILALSGRSLLHVRNTLCDSSADTKKADSMGFLRPEVLPPFSDIMYKWPSKRDPMSAIYRERQKVLLDNWYEKLTAAAWLWNLLNR